MKYLLLCLLSLLCACGGGSSSNVDVVVAAPTTLRADLYYGYYLTSPEQVKETLTHVNIIWVGGPWGEDVAIANMQQAQLPAVVDISNQVYAITSGGKHIAAPNREDNLRILLNKLRATDTLKYVIALYPIDEPDISVASEQDVLDVNKSVRIVMSEYVELKNCALAVIYANGTRFGLATYDWLGFDAYGDKSSIFTNGKYSSFVATLTEKQRIILVPGGYVGQDPTPFFNKAETDSKVLLLLPFLWADTTDFLGIRSLPIRNDYCLVGEQIKTPNTIGACK